MRATFFRLLSLLTAVAAILAISSVPANALPFAEAPLAVVDSNTPSDDGSAESDGVVVPPPVDTPSAAQAAADDAHQPPITAAATASDLGSCASVADTDGVVLCVQQDADTRSRAEALRTSPPTAVLTADSATATAVAPKTTATAARVKLPITYQEAPLWCTDPEVFDGPYVNKRFEHCASTEFDVIARQQTDEGIIDVGGATVTIIN
jgi:hypothetical protein